MARTVYVRGAGKTYSFPDGTPDEQIVSYLSELHPAAPPPAPPPEEPVGALESGFYGSLGKLEAAGGKTAQAVGLEGLSQYLLDESRKSQEYAAKYKPEVADISQIGSVGDVASFAGSTIAQSAPETAVGVGGAYVGAMVGGSIGAAVGAPAFGVGAVPGAAAGATIGGIIGGAIASLPFFVGGNLQRQAEEQGISLEQTDLEAASVGAVAQAPLDAAFEMLIARKLPGAGPALNVIKRGFLKEIAVTAGTGAVTEALTEPAQQAIELAQANPEKLLEFGPDVQREILNSAAAGALAGGVIGGGAGAVGAVTGPSETTEQKAARTELAGEVRAGQKRSEELVRFGEINSGVESLVSQPTVGKLKLRKITIEPTKENKLSAPIDRFQVTDYKGSRIAEFSNPENAVAAVDRYKALVKKNVSLEALDTGKEIPTTKITRPPVSAAPAAPTVQPAPEPIVPEQVAPTSFTQAPTEQPVGVYKTAKGSEYRVFPDGTTVRNKAARKDPGHEGDSGLKPRTVKTIYIDPQSVPGGAANLSAAGISNLGPQGARVALKDGKANLVTWNQKENGWGVAPMQGDIPYSLSPAKGLQPLELWAPAEDVPGFESYSNMHAGNEIVEISGMTAAEPAPVAVEAAPEGIAALPIGAVEAAPEVAVGAPVVAPEAAAQEAPDVIAVTEAEQEAARKQIEERNAKVADGARAALVKFGLKDVDTKFVPAFMNGLRVAATRGTEARIKDKSIITIATGIYDPDLTTEELVSKVVGVMDHEAIHSLRTLGLLRDAEMNMLLDAAGTTKVPGKAFTYLDYAKKVYEPLARTNPVYRNPDAIREEAVAEMFRDWREKKLAPPKVRGIFNRVFEALRGMFNSMRRENYATIFKDIEEGRVGRRPRGVGAQRKGVKKTVNKFEEPELRISVEPEAPRFGISPEYPFGQQVPEVTPMQMDAVGEKIEYGAGIYGIMRVLNSRTMKLAKLDKLMPSQERVESFTQAFVDQMMPVGLLQDYIKKNGGNVPEAMDVFMYEDLMRSKTNDSMIEREVNLYEPIIEFIRNNNIDIDEFQEYLYALHAPERNRIIRARNPKAPPELGSGMSDKDAKEIVKSVEDSPLSELYSELEKKVRAIIDDTNSLRVAGGLSKNYDGMWIPDGEGNLIKVDSFKKYVPLRGFEEESDTDGDISDEMRARIGKGLNIRGREDKQALGRTSRAGDILAHIMLQNTEAVIRAAKNSVGIKLLDLVEANPELSAERGVKVLTSGKKPMKRYLSPEGIVKTMVDPIYKNRDDVLVVKKNGEEIPIQITNPGLQKALIAKRGLSSDSAEKVLGVFQWMNRMLGGMLTAWNPEFMLINFPRDLQTALVGISQYEVDGIKTKILKDSVGSIMGVFKAIRNPKDDSEWAQWFKQFKQDGGYISGFYGLTTLEDRIKSIEEMAKDPSGTVSGRTVKAVKAVGGLLEDMNGAFENAIRLSVYKNLVETKKVSRDRAAYIAKNLTVNFDKRGSYGSVINSLYLFYNASIQGTWGLLTAAGRSKKVRRALGGFFVMGMMQDLVNNLFSGEDEDGEKFYDKIPDYVLENNIVIMDPTGFSEKGYFAIPLQYGLNAFYNTGRAVSRTIRGKYKTGQAASSIIWTGIDAFNPIGGTESFVNFIAPTTIDPFVHLLSNQDAFGRRISPEPFPGSVPKAESQQYWSSTSPIFKYTADYLNTFTGGTEYVPGMIDISPTKMEYMWDFLLGGVGATLRRLFDTSTNTIPSMLVGDWENIEMNNVPVLRKVVGNVSERVTFEDYFQKVNHVLARGEELKSAIKEGDAARIKSVRERFRSELKIYPAVRALANKRNQLASELRKLRENAKIPPEVRLRRQDILQKQIEQLTKRVSKLYEDNVDSEYPSLFS